MKNWLLDLVRCMAFVTLPVMGWGQSTGANVINFRINTNVTVPAGTPLTVTTSPLANIGQTSHLVVISGSGFSGTFWGVTGSIQGSIDGSTWFDIGPICNSFVYTTKGTIQLNGLQPFPYIRANFTVTSTGGSVVITSLYTGTSSPALIAPISTGPVLVTDDDFQYARMDQQAFTAGQQLNLTAGTCKNANQFPMLYGITVSNASTATHVNFHAVGVTSGTDINMWGAYLPVNGNIVLPNSERAYAISGQATGFTTTEFVKIQVSSSAATNLSVYPVFRCETSK